MSQEQELEEALARLPDAQLAMAGYHAMCKTLLKHQAYYNRHQTYMPITYDQALESVYLNDQYMLSEYLPGLFISHWLWPHHYQQLKFFEKTFLSMIKQKRGKVLLEVGVGSGAYSYHALKVAPGLAIRAIDVSPAAIEFSTVINPSRFHAHLGTIEQQPDESEDWLVCVEVLEHLEDPELFLYEVDRVLKPGGHAFITAAINAGSPDHIFLYNSPDQVENQLLNAGFRVLDKFSAQAESSKDRQLVPEVVAFLVKKSLT